MNKKQEGLWELYLDIIDYTKEYMKLSLWEIALIGVEKPGTAYATLVRCEYTYYNAEIEFDNARLLFNEKIEIDFDEVFKLFTHELCHIFTGAGSNYMNDDINKQNHLNYIGQIQYSMICNDIVNQEESLTNILDRTIVFGIQKDKEYKEFEKRFNKLTKPI